MRDHPALPWKYDIVQYTRGDGVEVKPVLGSTLYAHFRTPGICEPKASCDFAVLVDTPRGDWEQVLKPGGHLVEINTESSAGLRIHRMGPAGLEAADAWKLEPRDHFRGTAIVVRYGGFGDMLQASSIFPALRAQGYNVHVMTTLKGKDIIAHDPHVDGWLLQDTDQVPNHELPAFWERQATRCDRFINLSESVEGTFLAYEGRTSHSWPHAVRHQMLNRNYLEFTAALAEVPYAPGGRFYPTQERADVDRFLTRLRLAGKPKAGPVNAPPVFTVMLVLAGSSPHKMWPHMDTMMRSVLALVPEARFVLVGDQVCQLLEQGWEDHPRVTCTAGKLAIRQTLALAQRCDVVIGPETGVLNAVAFEADVRKVVLLSHSSVENLTRDWVNTDSMVPDRTPCYPCHQLHTGRKFCPEYRESGAAQCAFDIPSDLVRDAVWAEAKRWRVRVGRPALELVTA